VQPIVVDLFLVRAAQAGELRIAPGRAVMARVVQARAAEGGRGLLSIAGELIEAELPRQLTPGDEVRLVVRHVSADKVHLSLGDPRAPGPPAPPPAAEIPLPGGGTLRVPDDDAREQQAARPNDGHSHTLSLRYEAPALGAVDFRFALDRESLQIAVALAPGSPLDLAQQNADTLEHALTQQLDRAVRVTVSPRREPLDVYA
jgi:hypothetical protein